MANLSNATRKEQVLRFLTQHADRWVDGPELANAQVGGSEGLKRVRELRAEGHRIITRPHPDRTRDVFQYKLVLPESIAPVVQSRLAEMASAPSGPGPDLPSPATQQKPPQPAPPSVPTKGAFLMRRTATGEYELTKEVCIECGGLYDDDLEHRTTDAQHLRWVQAEEQRTGQTTIGVPEQPRPYRYTTLPTRIEVGMTIMCPRCKGAKRSERRRYDRKTGQTIITPAEEFTRDPFHQSDKNGQPNLCPRCGGFGVVPQYVGEDDAVQPVQI